MKKIYLIALTLFLSCQFLTSCSNSNKTLSSFSKRKYLKKSRSIKRKEKQKEVVYTIKEEPKVETEVKEEYIPTEILLTEEKVTPNNLAEPKTHALEESIHTEVPPIKERIISDKEDLFPEKFPLEVIETTFEKKVLIQEDEADHTNEEPERKSSTLASLSLGSLILGAFLSLLAFGSYATDQSITALAFIGPALVVTALILGILAVVKINKNPDQYKGMETAIVSILFGLIGVGIGFLTLSAFF